MGLSQTEQMLIKCQECILINYGAVAFNNDANGNASWETSCLSTSFRPHKDIFWLLLDS